MENLDAGDRMNFVPPIIVVGYVGASDAHVITIMWKSDLGMEICTRELRFATPRKVIADDFYH